MKKLTLILGILISLTVITNAQNNALHLDGTDDYVSISNISPAISGSGSFEFWIKLDRIPTTNARILSREWTGSGNEILIDGNVGTINTEGAFVNGENLESTNALPVGVWTHVAITADANGSKLYFNGVLEDEGGAATFSIDRYQIGGVWTDGFYECVPGYIDEVRLWNDVRTQAEIRQNMYRELPNPTGETNLVAYYKLNESDGTSIASDSKNSNNGTLTNMTGNEWTTSPAFFGPKKAYYFNGTDSYVGLGTDLYTDNFSSGTAITIEYWFRGTLFQPAVVFKDVFGSSSIICGYRGAAYSLFVISTDGGIDNGVRIASNELLEDGNWHHIACTWEKYTGNGFRTYVDGVLSQYTMSTNVNLPAGDDIEGTLGAYLQVAYMNGELDEVRIWTDVRTETEIRENMYKSLVGNEPNLVAYYNFDGNALPNIVSDNYDGSPQNIVCQTSEEVAFNTWLNTGNSDWATTTNWSSGAVPGSTDNVGIPNSGGSQPITAAALTTNNLVVGDEATLTFNSSGSHTIRGSAFVIGTSNINSGNLLTVTGSLYVLPLSALNVKAGGQLTVDNKLEVLLNGALTLNSTSSGTGSLIADGIVTGDVTVERYMNNADWTDWRDGWHFLSSPVSEQTISSNFTTAPYDFYCWWELTNEWINYKNQSTTTPYWTTANTISNGMVFNYTTNFLLGKGYMAAYDEEGTKSFTGTLNTATNVEITGLDVTDGGTNRSWHLLGNPFSSGLIWDATWTTTTIGGTIQIWNESGQSYTPILAATTGIIPATNGFMIQATADASAVTIPASKRVHGGTFYKSSNFPIIKLKASNIDYSSFQESQLLFIPESTTGYESEYDGDFLAGYAPIFYSKINGEPMVVNSMPNVEETTTIPFTFIKNEGLNFSIEMYESENMVMDVWLFDNKLNKDHNLTLNPVYFFTAFENDSPERFNIHFSPLGVDEPTTANQLIQLWAANNTINIFNKQNLSGDVKVLNTFGQLVVNTKLTGDANQQIAVNSQSGIYIVNITTKKGIVNKKVYLR